MPKYRIEFALNLIVRAEDHREALDKADAYLAEHSSEELNPEFLILALEECDDDIPSNIE